MKNNTSAKYWENEEAIVTEATGAEVHYYKEAGKIQLYATYEKDGETKLGRAAVWDNNNMDADDVVNLAFAVMQGLIDVGVENDAFADAYELLKNAVGAEDSDDEEADDVLDEEFEDEEIPDYKSMKLKDLKELCFECDIEIPAKPTSKALIALLDEYYADSSDSDDEDEEDEEEEAQQADATEFVGKNIVWDGEKYKKANRKVGKDYMDWMADADEWVSYILEKAEEFSKMPTKTQKQKKAQDTAYAELDADVKDWVSEWDGYCELSKVTEITRSLELFKMTYEVAMAKFASIIDSLKF